MNKNSEYEDKVISYERQLARSFNFVIREAEQLYQGQGRLRKTYDRLTKRLEALGVAYGSGQWICPHCTWGEAFH